MASSSHHSTGYNGTVGSQQVEVVVVPLPAQGHLNQLLQLSRLISSYSIPVHYVGTPSGNCQARSRVHGGSDPSWIANINFHEFPTPSIHIPPPPSNPNNGASSINFPSLLQPLSESSSQHLRQPVASLVRRLSARTRRVIIIHDSLMGSVVQDIVSLSNVEPYTFHSVSAFTILLFLWERLGRPFAIETRMIQDLPSLEGCFTPEFLKFICTQHEYMRFNRGRIYNTCRVVEGAFLDLLSKQEISEGKKQFALGPFNPVDAIKSSFSRQRHRCLKWLDRQPKNSVILVCFGTTTSFSDQQIIDLANGLEESKQRFLWVLRDADKLNLFDHQNERKLQFPIDEFEDRIGGRGLVVRDWAPQLEILAHPATGGFLSHCGWNSCMESITFGVPIATWPMHSDQPRNAILVAKTLGVGLVVKDWGRRLEPLTAPEIARAVKTLMASKEGEEIRKRAAELGGSVRRSMEEGGVGRMEWDKFIAHITR